MFSNFWSRKLLSFLLPSTIRNLYTKKNQKSPRKKQNKTCWRAMAHQSTKLGLLLCLVGVLNGEIDEFACWPSSRPDVEELRESCCDVSRSSEKILAQSSCFTGIHTYEILGLESSSRNPRWGIFGTHGTLMGPINPIISPRPRRGFLDWGVVWADGGGPTVQREGSLEFPTWPDNKNLEQNFVGEADKKSVLKTHCFFVIFMIVVFSFTDFFCCKELEFITTGIFFQSPKSFLSPTW